MELIAHRGDTVNFPENTVEAFSSAFAHGADGVELDVQLHEGQLILIHDYLFDADENYPQLAEVLKLHAYSGKLQLDIKALSLEFLPRLKELLAPYEEADIELITNVWPIAHHLRQEFPTHKLGIIFPPKEFEAWMTEEFICTKVVKLMSVMGGDVAHIPWATIQGNPSVVSACHTRNVRVQSHIPEKDWTRARAVYREMGKLAIDQCGCSDVVLINALKNAQV